MKNQNFQEITKITAATTAIQALPAFKRTEPFRHSYLQRAAVIKMHPPIKCFLTELMQEEPSVVIIPYPMGATAITPVGLA